MLGRLILAIVAAGASALLAPAPAPAQEDVELRGEILDLTCYLHKGSKGRRHRACAEMCAEKGLPVGILTDKEEVFLLIEDHDQPEPYAAAVKLAGQNAVIKGKKYSKGSVTGIMVLDATKQ